MFFEDPISLVIVIVGFFLVLAALALPRIMRKQVDHAATLPADNLRSAENAALERVEKSLLELEETSRELFGRLDTRTRVLIRLIEEAEIQSQRLEKLLDQRKP